MLLRQMRYFVAVMERGNFTEAAEACFVSQSAISQQIKALEAELGVRLLDRHNRTFTPTEAGRFFYQRARAILPQIEALREETMRLGRGGKQALTVGYLTRYEGTELARAVADFTRSHPAIALKLRQGTHEDLYRDLRSGAVDMALSDQRRAFSTGYVNRVLSQAELVVAIAAASPLAQGDAIDAAGLAATPCILVASEAGQEDEAAYFQDALGIGHEFRFAANMQEARLMVVAGLGFLPYEGTPGETHYDTSVKILPLLLRGQPIQRTYCAFWQVGNRKPGIEDFADLLGQEFG